MTLTKKEKALRRTRRNLVLKAGDLKEDEERLLRTSSFEATQLLQKAEQLCRSAGLHATFRTVNRATTVIGWETCYKLSGSKSDLEQVLKAERKR